MPVAITIRNVPDEVRDELAARAARAGQSLQAYLRAELARIALVPTVDEVLARANARLDKHPTKVTVESILAILDESRR